MTNVTNGILTTALLLASAAAARADAPAGAFGNGRASFHPTQVAPYRLDDSIIRLHFDVARGIVYGDETVTLHVKRGGERTLPFNTFGLHYAKVTLGGRPARYSLDDAAQLIRVALPPGTRAGAALALGFTYWSAPQRGIYFVRPDKYYPEVTPEIWSQGEPTDNRRWFPTWDEPNEKTASELIVTVPRGWTVVGNGLLKGHTHSSTGDTWDWNSPHRKSPYLIAFAAGPLVRNHTTLGALDVDSYVQPPYAKLNATCFGNTNAMVDFYQRRIGVAYPFDKYDQITAERFIYGGMENASATIVTAHALHPAIEDLENPCDPLVSHELAQHWFGDDVTMSDWSNVWINEGFATYFDELWTARRFGDAAFEYARYNGQLAYFDETKQYMRPIVDYVYADPIDLFDASGHERPAQILHMLRYMFGDRRFFAALREYLLAYEYRNADTHQFFAAIGKTLGTDLTWFEKQWFYRTDYPHYEVSDSYDAAAKTLVVRVKQKNREGKPYRMPVVIEAFFDGRTARIEPVIDRNDQSLRLTGVTSRPRMVLFDPNNNVLRQLTYPKPVADLAYQLANAPYVGDREWALAQLAGFAKAQGPVRAAAAAGAREAALADGFYGIRSDAVAVAAAFGDAATVHAALHDADKRVRIAAESAAGSLRRADAAVVDDLNALASDPDPIVAGGALASLGSLRAPASYDRLVAALKRPSFGDTIAASALAGLAAYGDAAALPLIEARTAYGTPEQERDAAVIALARLAARVKQQRPAVRTLQRLVDNDPLIATRIAAVRALEILGDPAAIPILERVESTDSQFAVQLEARKAAAALTRSAMR